MKSEFNYFIFICTVVLCLAILGPSPKLSAQDANSANASNAANSINAMGNMEGNWVLPADEAAMDETDDSVYAE